MHLNFRWMQLSRSVVGTFAVRMHWSDVYHLG